MNEEKNSTYLNKMDLVNLLEIFIQWEVLAFQQHYKISPEAIDLKLKLEKELL